MPEFNGYIADVFLHELGESAHLIDGTLAIGMSSATFCLMAGEASRRFLEEAVVPKPQFRTS